MKPLYNDPNLRIQKMNTKMALNHLPNKAVFIPISKAYTSHLYTNINSKTAVSIYKRNKNHHIVLKYVNEYGWQNNRNITETFFLLTFCPRDKPNGIEIRDLFFRILLNKEPFPNSLEETIKNYEKNHGLHFVRFGISMKVLSTFVFALSQPAVKISYFLNSLRYFLKETLMKLQFR